MIDFLYCAFYSIGLIMLIHFDVWLFFNSRLKKLELKTWGTESNEKRIVQLEKNFEIFRHGNGWVTNDLQNFKTRLEKIEKDTNVFSRISKLEGKVGL